MVVKSMEPNFFEKPKGTIMLQTIEVEIDPQGVIHPMQALPLSAERRSADGGDSRAGNGFAV